MHNRTPRIPPWRRKYLLPSRPIPAWRRSPGFAIVDEFASDTVEAFQFVGDSLLLCTGFSEDSPSAIPELLRHLACVAVWHQQALQGRHVIDKTISKKWPIHSQVKSPNREPGHPHILKLLPERRKEAFLLRVERVGAINSARREELEMRQVV